jgi:hypothetical protein
MWKQRNRTLGAAIGCLVALAGTSGRAAAPPVQTYIWSGQFAAADPAAKTVTVKLQIPEPVAKSTNRFKAGDRIVVVWDMIERIAPPPAPPQPDRPPDRGKGYPNPRPSWDVVVKNESNKVLYVETYETMKAVDAGYILPAEFVAADGSSLTVKLHVVDQTLQALKAAQPGTSIRMTTSINQPTEVVAITAASVSN